MKYYLLKDFKESLLKLMQYGGAHRLAGEKVKSLIADITMAGKEFTNDPFIGLKLTKWGENRIKHCVKYDLSDYDRLITIKDNGVCAICFVGKHDDSEKWLERNKGLILSVNSQNQLEPLYESEDIDLPDRRIAGVSDYSDGVLYKKLGSRYYNAIAKDVERTVLIEFEHLTSVAEDEEILELAYKIESKELQDLFFDVFTLLKNSDVDKAKKRIDLYKNKSIRIEDLDDEKIESIVEGNGIIDLSSFPPDILKHLMDTMDYQQWMLFMHPDQSNIVDEDFSGPAKLIGVSGSGKTAIIVRRAVRLAKKYVNQKILILTLNRSLSKLIEELVNRVCPPNYRSMIIVKSFWELCRDYLIHFEPGNNKLYDEITWKNNEHIDEIWQEYYQCLNNNDDAKVLAPIHRSLNSRNVFPIEYIRQEFDWIRSAFAPADRNEYMSVERKGRGEKFDTGFREKILLALNSWEDKMNFVGVTDYLGLVTALYKHIERLPAYRSILVDEEQDFGTIELSIIRKLVKPDENDLFLTGDVAQRVSLKHHTYSKAGIILGNRVRKIKKNYRNSREILDAAYNILKSNVVLDDINNEDFELLDPEYANFSTNRPLILQAPDFGFELGTAIDYLNAKLSDKQKGCIAICGITLKDVKKIGMSINFNVLDGTSSLGNSKIFLSDLEQTKGFEFDTMCIVNCNDNIIPNHSLPKEEWYYDICKLYVAMTRAKSELIISYSSTLSQIFTNFKDYFVYADWSEHKLLSKVDPLPVFDEDQTKSYKNEIPNMTGDRFLYTKMAVGISLELQNKLVELITGRSSATNGKTTEWKTIENALNETNIPNIAQQFGPKTWKEFRELFGKK
jgi:superfamily I DNA/RNA helicase